MRLEALSAEPAHAAGMFELWRQPKVCEHSGRAEDSIGREIALPAESREASGRLLQYWLDRAEAGTGFRWAVIGLDPPGSSFVGAVGFNAMGATAEYAYHLVPGHWGAGLATEASRLALSWCFGQGAERVVCFIEPANWRSIRLAERLGFESRGATADAATEFALERGAFGGVALR